MTLDIIPVTTSVTTLIGACSRGLRSRMRRSGWLLLVLMLLHGRDAAAQFSGPAPTPSSLRNVGMEPTTDPAILYPGQREIELGPGDQIAVHLYEATDYTPTIRVSIDGTVQLPLIGLVHVAGLTVHQAEDAIAARLIAAGMYRSPQITVQLLESSNQIITVIGEVHGVVSAVGGNKRLYDVLAAAGGLPSTASHLITINRPGQAQPIVVDLGPDPARSNLGDVPVFSRDTIVVARVGVVYLLGAFKTQGAIPIQPYSPLTLMQAASLGSGAGFEGKSDDLRIVRTVGLERKMIRVDLNKIFKGQEPDPVLQADDIVFLPSSAMKAAIKSGGIGTALGILSVLFYAASTR